MRALMISILCALSVGSASGQDSAKPGEIPQVSGWVMAAHLLTTVAPDPPKTPIGLCSSAVVTLDVVVEKDGSVGTVKVSGGYEDLQDSAAKAVKQWTYRPYLLNGAPARVETTVMVLYPHDGKPGPMAIPDGKGGIKGGNFAPMPSECTQKNVNKAAPSN
jgi:TonB family protein